MQKESKQPEQKTVELWEGKVVPVEREYLIKDVDFIRDLTKARKEQDFGTIIDMTFAVVGENTFEETRQHIIEEKGYFDVDELSKVMERIASVFPKASSPAQKRW